MPQDVENQFLTAVIRQPPRERAVLVPLVLLVRVPDLGCHPSRRVRAEAQYCRGGGFAGEDAVAGGEGLVETMVPRQCRRFLTNVRRRRSEALGRADSVARLMDMVTTVAGVPDSGPALYVRLIRLQISCVSAVSHVDGGYDPGGRAQEAREARHARLREAVVGIGEGAADRRRMAALGVGEAGADAEFEAVGASRHGSAVWRAQRARADGARGRAARIQIVMPGASCLGSSDLGAAMIDTGYAQ